MRRAGAVAAVLAACALTGAAAPPPTPPLMKWADLYARPKPTEKPERIRYGPAASQVIDLWRPTTPGPHPVVAMIHGGCWTASIANLHIMDWAAADLAKRGIAVWNIEYRRLGEEGGGYPGTYQDVAVALRRLTDEAPARGLSVHPLVVVGHSAGGHLALWSAGVGSGRGGALSRGLPKPTPKVDAVIDLAGLADLERDTDTGCGPEPVTQMAGSPPVFAETSPAHMLPLKADLYIIHGAREVTVPVAVGTRFAEKARVAGDRVQVFVPPGAHVEEIAPGSEAWEKTIAPLIVRLATGHAR